MLFSSDPTWEKLAKPHSKSSVRGSEMDTHPTPTGACTEHWPGQGTWPWGWVVRDRSLSSFLQLHVVCGACSDLILSGPTVTKEFSSGQTRAGETATAMVDLGMSGSTPEPRPRSLKYSSKGRHPGDVLSLSTLVSPFLVPWSSPTKHLPCSVFTGVLLGNKLCFRI